MLVASGINVIERKKETFFARLSFLLEKKTRILFFSMKNDFFLFSFEYFENHTGTHFH